MSAAVARRAKSVAMSFTDLDLKGFTVFDDAHFGFASGLNVLVGENGTGKSQVLKLLWANHETQRRGATYSGRGRDIIFFIQDWFCETFGVRDFSGLVSLGRSESADAVVSCNVAGVQSEPMRFGHIGESGWHWVPHLLELGPHRAIFIPSREVISLLPGFVAAWDKRESSFDRTHRELCADLTVPPLRALSSEQRALLAPLEAAIGGKLVQNGERFTIETTAGAVQMPMVGEGLRKIAQLIQLVRNGTLEPGGILLWDEPEASLSPKLAHALAETILGLVRLGLQVFIFTHDYVLASELSLGVGNTLNGRAPIDAAFFGLSRVGQGPVSVERASSFETLQTNPILDAFTALHEREARGREDEAS